MQKVIDARFKTALDNANYSVTLLYGNNTKRTNLRFVGEYKNEMHLVFPQPLAEILGVDKTIFGRQVSVQIWCRFKNT